jgi:hypothetical protein
LSKAIVAFALVVVTATLAVSAASSGAAQPPQARPILFVRFVHYLGALSVGPTIYSIKADGTDLRRLTRSAVNCL